MSETISESRRPKKTFMESRTGQRFSYLSTLTRQRVLVSRVWTLLYTFKAAWTIIARGMSRTRHCGLSLQRFQNFEARLEWRPA